MNAKLSLFLLYDEFPNCTSDEMRFYYDFSVVNRLTILQHIYLPKHGDEKNVLNL